MRHHNNQKLNFPLLSTLIAHAAGGIRRLVNAALACARSVGLQRLLPAPAAAATSHGMYSTGHKLEPLEQLRQSRWRYTAGALPKATCWQAHARAQSCSANRSQLHSILEATQVFTEEAPATQVSVASALFLDIVSRLLAATMRCPRQVRISASPPPPPHIPQLRRRQLRPACRR